ncbi:hypothetical protein T4A_13057, partial [Trichinella pseudospiralis]
MHGKCSFIRAERAIAAKQTNVKTTIKNLHVTETSQLKSDEIIGTDISVKTKFKTLFINLPHSGYIKSREKFCFLNVLESRYSSACLRENACKFFIPLSCLCLCGFSVDDCWPTVCGACVMVFTVRRRSWNNIHFLFLQINSSAFGETWLEHLHEGCEGTCFNTLRGVLTES